MQQENDRLKKERLMKKKMAEMQIRGLFRAAE